MLTYENSTSHISAHHLQKASVHPFSGGGGRAGLCKLGSGQSPFISRLQPPVTFQKMSKSMSPPLLGRISPFSQTVYSNSWSTFYSEESAMTLEPLLPQLCMSLVGEIKERWSPKWGTVVTSAQLLFMVILACVWGCLLSVLMHVRFCVMPWDSWG